MRSVYDTALTASCQETAARRPTHTPLPWRRPTEALQRAACARSLAP